MGGKNLQQAQNTEDAHLLEIVERENLNNIFKNDKIYNNIHFFVASTHIVAIFFIFFLPMGQKH